MRTKNKIFNDPVPPEDARLHQGETAFMSLYETLIKMMKFALKICVTSSLVLILSFFTV